MIIVLNGYPGVGKLTIGKGLADLLGARLLDAHTVYNVAFATTEFRSPAFYETVEAVERIAYARVRDLPADVDVVLTVVLTEPKQIAHAAWARIEALAVDRGGLAVVHLRCDLDEHVRRIQSPGRGAKRKPQDAAMAERNHAEAKPLLGQGAAHLLSLNVTTLEAQQAAQKIATWRAGL